MRDALNTKKFNGSWDHPSLLIEKKGMHISDGWTGSHRNDSPPSLPSSASSFDHSDTSPDAIQHQILFGTFARCVKFPKITDIPVMVAEEVILSTPHGLQLDRLNPILCIIWVVSSKLLYNLF